MKKEPDLKHMISREIPAFLIDRRRAKRSENTITFYEFRLKPWLEWCTSNGIIYIEDLTPTNLREFFLSISGHSAGGQHAYWRAIKAFLRWWDRDTEPENWKNPIYKIDSPKLSKDPIPGIRETEFTEILKYCDRSFYGIRDKAILSFLYDTGVRVSELCNILIDDVDMTTGIVFIRRGKGGKSRYVFMGNTCAHNVMKYLRKRSYTEDSYLFAHKDEVPFTREGIGSILEKYNKLAGIKSNPSPHDYRRAWFHHTLKKVDEVSTARVGGHANTSLLWKYNYQDPDDLREAVNGSSPLDNLSK